MLFVIMGCFESGTSHRIFAAATKILSSLLCFSFLNATKGVFLVLYIGQLQSDLRTMNHSTVFTIWPVRFSGNNGNHCRCETHCVLFSMKTRKIVLLAFFTSLFWALCTVKKSFLSWQKSTGLYQPRWVSVHNFYKAFKSSINPIPSVLRMALGT